MGLRKRSSGPEDLETVHLREIEKTTAGIDKEVLEEYRDAPDADTSADDHDIDATGSDHDAGDVSVSHEDVDEAGHSSHQ